MTSQTLIRSASMAALCAALVGSAAAQDRPSDPPPPTAQIAAIDKLAHMTGDWRGEGWMDFGGFRTTFRGSEVVTRKLGGTVLLVEGNFTARPPGATADIPVHTTLGVISYDPATRGYRFTTWLATGTSGDRELVVTPEGWQWEIKSPRGVTRYRTSLTADRWLEIGERSPDGEKWVQFFEMTLRKH